MFNPLFHHFSSYQPTLIAKETIQPYGSKRKYTFALEGYALEASFLKPIFKTSKRR